MMTCADSPAIVRTRLIRGPRWRQLSLNESPSLSRVRYSGHRRGRFRRRFYGRSRTCLCDLLHQAGKKHHARPRLPAHLDALRDLLLEGLLPSGIDVVDVGVVPTPLLYFSVLHWKMDGGAMITGSHNAAEYNGFKLGVGPTTIFGAEIQRAAPTLSRSATLSPSGKAAR